MIEVGLFAQLQAVDAITDIVGTRIYPNIAPEESTFPFIVYMRTATARPTSHDGSAGVAFATIAIKCVSDQYSDVKALAEEVRVALDGLTNPIGSYTATGCIVENEYDDPDPPQSGEEEPLYGVRLEVKIGFNEPTS